MKKTILILLINTFLLASCTNQVSDSNSVEIDNNTSVSSEISQEDSSELIQRNYSVESFHSLYIDANVQICYKQGPCDVQFEGYENAFENLNVTVSNDTLTITSKPQNGFGNSYNSTPTITIYAETLNYITFNGSGSFDTSDTIKGNSLKGDSLFVDVSGSGAIKMDVEVQSFHFFGSGSFDAKLSGTAKNTILALSGSGKIDGMDLQTEYTTASISGSGDLSITCDGTLDMELSGSGNIRYRGTASTTKSISGSGEITKED